MPTITRTTSGMIGPSTAEIQSRVDNLRSRFSSGNTILASDLNELNSMYVYFNDHYHSTSDYAFEAYGNTAPVGTYYAADPRYTGGMIDARGYQGNQNDGGPGGVNAGDVITAAYHEGLRVMYLGANGHYHQVDDVVY